MKRLVLLLILLALAGATAHAGGLMSTGLATAPYLFPTEIEITTTIRNQVAVTVTKQTFVNTTGSPRMLSFLFPTPINAAITGLRWWQNGELRVAQISGKPQDTALLGDPGSSGGGNNSPLAAYLGASPLVFPFRDSLPKDGEIIVELTYVELLRYGGGQVLYSFPLDMRTFNAPPAMFAFDFRLDTDRDILSATSPSHPGLATQFSPRRMTASLPTPTISLDRNLDVAYTLAQSALGVSLLSNKPANDDGYFLMLAEPDPKTSQQAVIDKVFTFVIDVSGSMTGSKLEQAKEAARYTIEHLNPEDRFNIVKFSSGSEKFRPNPVPATAVNVIDGIKYIQGLVANGGTNMQEALLQALAQEMPDSTSNVIIFLTDGIATLDQQRIISANTRNTRIFVFGVGQDVNQSLLTQLATGNNGIAEFLGTDDVSKRIPEFYNKIRHPLLQNVSLTFSAGDVYEIYPLQLPDIYVGEQLVVLGRYKTPGEARATLSGRSVDRRVDYDYNVTFTGDSLVDIFIPKMWAKYKIDALLVLMKGVPQNSNQWKEWRAEIIRLSRAYGILSPFSSFSDPGSGDGNGGGPSSTVVSEREDVLGESFAVRYAPNPFRASTVISFVVPEGSPAQTTITIYDLAGNVVAVIVDDMLEPGTQQFTWLGRDMLGDELPAGVYICEVRIGGRKHVGRIVLMR